MQYHILPQSENTHTNNPCPIKVGWAFSLQHALAGLLATAWLAFNSAACQNRMLICLSTTLDSGQSALPTVTAATKLSHMRRNILKALEETDEQIVFHQCQDFDVLSKIQGEKKKQPESNRQEDFEAYNEPQLEPISGNIVIIKDK